MDSKSEVTMWQSSREVSEVPNLQTATLPELAARANEAHAQCLGVATTTLQHAKAAGEALSAAKAKVAHGDWEDWLQSNFVGGRRAAQRYIRIHRKWRLIEQDEGRKTHGRAHLAPRLRIEAAERLVRDIPLPSLDDGPDVWLCLGEGDDVAELRPVAHAPGYHRLSVYHDAFSGDVVVVDYDTRGCCFAIEPRLLEYAIRRHRFRPISEWHRTDWAGSLLYTNLGTMGRADRLGSAWNSRGPGKSSRLAKRNSCW